MKHNILKGLVIIVALLFAVKSHSQIYYSVPPQALSYGFDTLNTYMYNMYGVNVNDTAESGFKSEYKRWLTFWETRKCMNPSTGQNTLTEYFKQLNAYLGSEQQILCEETNEFRGNWELKGPKHLPTQSQGIIQSIWASSSNPDVIFAGSAFGGLWKKDGTSDWKNLTDNTPTLPGTMGIPCIVVDPINNDKIYLGTGLGPRISMNGSIGYGFGIIYSLDGGASWTQDATFLQAVNSSSVAHIFPYVDKLMLLPNTTKLIALFENKIWEKDISNMANSWTDITPTGVASGITFNDIELKHGTTNAYFVSTIGSASEIWEHLPNSTWQKITTGINFIINGTSFSAESMNAYYLSTSNNNLFAYVFGAYVANHKDAHLIKYNYSTSTWSVVYQDLPNTSADIAVSKNNDNIIYYGYLYNSILISTNNGVTYTSYNIGDYGYNNNTDPDHSDVRCIYIVNSTNSTNGIDDYVLYGNDGGASEKPPGNDPLVLGNANTIEQIDDDGLAISQWYGFDVSEQNALISGGVMHNGLCSYNKDRNPQWQIPVGFNDWYNRGVGDGYNAEFDKNNRTLSYGAFNEPSMTYYDYNINNNADWTFMQAPLDGDVLQVRPIEVEEGNNQLQVGSRSMYGVTSGSPANFGYTNLFSNFPLGSNFPTMEKVRAYKIAPTPNEAYKYVCFNGVGDFHLWRVNPNLNGSH